MPRIPLLLILSLLFLLLVVPPLAAKEKPIRIEGAIDQLGKARSYAFPMPACHLAIVSLTAPAGPVDHAVEVRDPDGKVVYRQKTEDGSKGEIRFLSGPIFAAEAGKYGVVVADLGNDETSPTQSFTLQIRVFPDPDRNELNHGAGERIGQARATKLVSGQATRGLISHLGDEDWYVLEGKAGQIVEVEVDNAPAATSRVDYSVGIYDDKGQNFFHDWFDGSKGPIRFHLRKTVPRTGKVYVCVWDRDHDDYETDALYKLTARILDPQDRNEPYWGGALEVDARRARVVKSGDALTGQIETLGDEDWYAIDMKANSILDLRLDNAPALRSPVRYSIGIYDASYRCLWQDWWDVTAKPLKIHARKMATEDGVMHVCIWSRDGKNFETDAPYHLTLSSVTPRDSHENNGGPTAEIARLRATPLESEKPTRGWIEHFGDQDWYRLDVEVGKLVDVRLDTGQAEFNGDLTLRIFDPKGRVLFDDWHSKSRLRPFDVTVAARRTGSYFIEIYDRDGNDFETEASYTLRCAIVDDPDVHEPNDGLNLVASFLMATPLEMGIPTTGFIQHREDRDYYALTHDGGALKIAFDGPVEPEKDIRFGYTIYDEKGRSIGSDWAGPNAPVRHRFDKEVPAGRYHVSIWTRDGDFSRQSPYTLLWGDEVAAEIPPQILDFRASSNLLQRPGRISLQWSTSNAERVELLRRPREELFDVAKRGTARLTVDRHEGFQLRAIKGKDMATRQLLVHVQLPGGASGAQIPGSPITPQPPTLGPPALPQPPTLGPPTLPQPPTFTPPTLPHPPVLPHSLIPPSQEDAAKANRRHVVLVHGTLGGAPQMAPLAGYLERLTNEKGEPLFQTHSINLSGLGIKGGVKAYATELRNFIAGEVPANAPFDLVGYSQGGLICRWYMLKLGGSDRVGKLVTFCGTHHGTNLGLIARISSAVGCAVGGPIVMPWMASSPVAVTARVVAPVAGTAGYAAAYAGMKSLKDQEVGSDVVTALYDGEGGKKRDAHAIWFERDRIVLPQQSARLQGATNYPLDEAAHVEAPRNPKVHRLVGEILGGTAKASGPQRLSLKEMIALKLVRNRDYEGLSTTRLLAELNEVLDKTVVLDRAEQALLQILAMAKKRTDWSEIWKGLDRNALWTKFQGKELEELYALIGPTAPIDCALARDSMIILRRDVTDRNIVAADPGLRARVLSLIFLHTPVAADMHERILQILECSKKESQANLDTVVRNVGGADRFYDLVWLPARKARLQALLPLTKSCLRCKLSGRKGQVKAWTTHRVTVDCPDCTGGLKDCSWCKGSGTVGQAHDCLICGGKGRQVCSWCGGDGKTGKKNNLNCVNPVFKGLSRHEKPCANCGGDGKIEAKPCGNPFCGKGCPRGKVRCPNLRCKGTGSWIEERKELEWQPCPNCNGTGEVPR